MPKFFKQKQILRRNCQLIALLLGIFLFIWWFPYTSLIGHISDYPTIHTAMETLAISVAILVFSVNWNTNNPEQSSNVILLGCAFLTVAFIDFAHMLSVKGMPEFVTPSGVEKGINFWLAARIIAALGLLTKTMPTNTQPVTTRQRFTYLGIALLVIALIYWVGLFHQAVLPNTFIEEQGLTTFKISTEWMIVSVLAIAAVCFFRQVHQGVNHDAANLFAAVVISILSELCFMLYKDVTDIFNLLGHIYKIVAYLFIYQAVFVESVKQPYHRLAEIQQKLLLEQEALSEQSAMLAMFYELPFMGMAITSPNSKRWISANDCLCKMLGYFRAELLKKTWVELTHPDDIGADNDQFQRLLSGEIDSYFIEKRFIHKNGTSVNTFINIKCVREKNGAVRDVIATVQDITERKHAEQALIEMNLQLEHRISERTAELMSLNQSLESFVYSVSHDLKTPLRGVDGYSRLLQEEYTEQLPAEGKLFISNIRNGIKRMNELIDDLLAYSRMERRKLSNAPLNLNQLLVNVIKEAGASDNQINIDIPTLTVFADADGLALVLRNLLENAIKFSRLSDNRNIDIGARHDQDNIVLWIKDYGIGFDMKYHDRIFEIFQRLHRIEDYPGTGIGLALVKKATQRMGGNVWAESNVSQGTIFYLQMKSSPEALIA